jgi:hypothetical protein
MRARTIEGKLRTKGKRNTLNTWNNSVLKRRKGKRQLNKSSVDIGQNMRNNGNSWTKLRKSFRTNTRNCVDKSPILTFDNNTFNWKTPTKNWRNNCKNNANGTKLSSKLKQNNSIPWTQNTRKPRKSWTITSDSSKPSKNNVQVYPWRNGNSVKV